MEAAIIASVALPLLALGLSALLTKGCIWLLPLLGLIDTPGERKIHEQAIPRGGGLAIIITFFAAWVCVLLFSPFFKNDLAYMMGSKVFFAALPATALLTLVGMADDKWGTKALHKLGLQFLVAAITWAMGVKFLSLFGVMLHPALSFALTTVWIVGFINAFNLIDGLDGLASGLGAIAAVCMGIKFITLGVHSNAVLMFCLAMACVGFLKYNYHPAKIFLGDTGSMFLGYIVAVSGIASCSKVAALSSVLVPVLAAGVPVFDTFLAIWRRSSNKLSCKGEGEAGSSLMTGDAEHLHHRILNSNHSQKLTAVTLYGIAICFAIGGVVVMLFNSVARNVAFILILLAFAAAIRILASVELWSSTKAIMLHAKTFQHRTLLSFLHPFLDIAMLAAAYFGCRFLLLDSIDLEDGPALMEMFLSIAFPMLFMIFGGIYKHFWTRAIVFSYVRLIWLIAIGELLALLASLHFTQSSSFSKLQIAFWLLFLLLSQAMLVGHRVLLRLAKIYLIGSAYTNKLKNGSDRAVIYGAGLNCQLYLTCLFNNMEAAPMEIVGLLDDDSSLWGQYAYGFKVLGDIDELGTVFESSPFKKIVLTVNLPQSRLQPLKDFCKAHGIALSSFDSEEKPVPL